jgi:hypothetical protein
MIDGNDLLLWMAAATKRDDAPPGFNGSLAVGVEGGGSGSWLLLKFGARAEATFSTTRPTGAQAELTLSHDEADVMLRTGQLAGTLSPSRVRGERQLLGQFAKRYLSSVSLIDFLAAQSN